MSLLNFEMVSLFIFFFIWWFFSQHSFKMAVKCKTRFSVRRPYELLYFRFIRFVYLIHILSLVLFFFLFFFLQSKEENKNRNLCFTYNFGCFIVRICLFFRSVVTGNIVQVSVQWINEMKQIKYKTPKQPWCKKKTWTLLETTNNRHIYFLYSSIRIKGFSQLSVVNDPIL